MPYQTMDGLQGREHKSGGAEVALTLALSMLPLHAEEGRRREVLFESELVEALTARGTSEETSRALVWTLRRQFEALGLLDPVDLSEGKWAFVSFSASLLGRSWLTVLATPDQSLFGRGYWGQDAPECDREEQRTILHRIESDRVRLNPEAAAIRTVHVAWAWIRIGDHFLMHRREDKARVGEKSFGLPGGRFCLDDLPAEIQTRAGILKEVFRLDSEVVAKYIYITLERELKEETGLIPGKHYIYEPFGRPLPPYMEVNGAGNRHAYSAYLFHLYIIKLTDAGETHLLNRISQNSDLLKWFSATDIAAARRSDGVSAYISALHHAWGTDFENNLSKVPNSGASPLPFKGESMMFDLPGTAKHQFQIGKPGKEKALRPSSPLEDAEWQLLMLLGWHARNFAVHTGNDAAVRLLGNGWVEAPGLIPLARSLHGKIHSIAPGLLEIREDRYVSLRISPDILFFSPGLFCYQIQGSNAAGGRLHVRRCRLVTPWGELGEGIYERDINGNTLAALRELEKGDEPGGDWERTLREQFGEGVKGIGLRRLWSTRGNVSCLVDGLRVSSRCKLIQGSD